MPFKSKAQLRKCYAMKARGKSGSWDCEEWAAATKSVKALPERVKKAMEISFSKIAKELFDPAKKPLVPPVIVQKEIIDSASEEKRKGLTPIEYRNELTNRRRGIVQKNIQAAKAA